MARGCEVFSLILTRFVSVIGNFILTFARPDSITLLSGAFAQKTFFSIFSFLYLSELWNKLTEKHMQKIITQHVRRVNTA